MISEPVFPTPLFHHVPGRMDPYFFLLFFYWLRFFTIHTGMARRHKFNFCFVSTQFRLSPPILFILFVHLHLILPPFGIQEATTSMWLSSAMGTFLCTSHRYNRSNQSMAHTLTMSQSHLTSYLPDYLPNTAGSIGCSLLYTLATYSLPRPWARSCFIGFALHGIIIIYCFFWNIQVEFDHGTEYFTWTTVPTEFRGFCPNTTVNAWKIGATITKPCSDENLQTIGTYLRHRELMASLFWIYTYYDMSTPRQVSLYDSMFGFGSTSNICHLWWYHWYRWYDRIKRVFAIYLC